MKILYQALSRLKETAEPTQCEEWFQQQLFGDKGSDIWFEPGTEPNTDTENRLLGIFEKHISKNVVPDSNSLELIERLYKCRHLFSNWLTPKAKYMYRGRCLEVRIKDIIGDMKSTRNIEPIDLKGIGRPHKFKSVKILTYKPHTKFQSWTSNPLAAAVFSVLPNFGNSVTSSNISNPNFSKLLWKLTKGIGTSSTIRLPIILRTKTNDSFFGSSNLGNRFSNEYMGYNEDEVFRLGGEIKCEQLVPEKFINSFLSHIDIETINE